MKFDDLIAKFKINNIPYNQPWQSKTLLQHLLDDFGLFTLENISSVVAKYKELNASEDDFSIVGSADGQTLVHRLITYNLARHRARLPKESVEEILGELTLYINVKNIDQKTPLQYLMDGACFDPVHESLYHLNAAFGAKPQGYTVNFTTIDALKLVSLGANAHLPNANGMPLLHCLITCSKYIAPHNLEALEQLKAYQVDFNSQNSQGETALQCLLNKKTLKFSEARLLIALGANPYVFDKDGNTIIHRIAYDFKENPVENFKDWIQEYKLNINCLNANNLTPLQFMMSNPQGLLTRDTLTLVELGADPSLKNASGLPLIHFLIQYHSGLIEKHNLEAIKQLCAQQQNLIHGLDSAGRTPLSCLLDKNNFNFNEITLLIQLGANPKDTNSEGQPWLHALCIKTNLSEESKTNIAKLLFEKKIDINSLDAQGQTVLNAIFTNTKRPNLDTVSFLMCGCNASFNTIFPPIDRLFHIANLSNPPKAMFDILNKWNQHTPMPTRITIEALLSDITNSIQEEILIIAYCKFLFTRSEYDTSTLSWLSSKVRFTSRDKFREIALHCLTKAAKENPNTVRNLLESALDDIVFKSHSTVGKFFNSIHARGASRPIKTIQEMLKNLPPEHSISQLGINNSDL